MVEMTSFDETLDGAWREFRERLATRMETLGGRIPLYIKQRDDEVCRHYVAMWRIDDKVVAWFPMNSAVDSGQRLSRASLTDLRRLGLTRRSA